MSQSAAPTIPQPAEAAAMDIALRWLQACVERDADFIDANSVDNPAPAFSSIGTAMAPFSLEDFSSHLRDLKKVGWGGLKLTGYQLGTAAWFYGMEDGLLPWGEALTIRISLTMVNIGGAWKVCQSHVSESVERSGIELEQA
jgi:hypothetical protein